MNPEHHGKVVAEFSFGFWRYLTASRYHASLWVPHLHKSFGGGSRDISVRRREVEARLSRLGFVRNRAAHHEPLIRRDLSRDLVAAIEIAHWISPDAGAWVAARSTLKAAIADRSAWSGADRGL